MSATVTVDQKLKLKYLEDGWNGAETAQMDEPELLRYRSNLLGSDLRITNFGGGNTSSKIMMSVPLDGKARQVLWVKGSGGDLGSIKRSGFATLYLDNLLALEALYRGVEFEDEMVDYYPLCTFGVNPVASSIDTALHGYLPFPHVDHLHPDCAIALAASANGKEKMEEFNRTYGHKLVWLPWQRPGFELAMMLKHGVASEPGCDGVILGGHGLFTWGNTQRECYANTIAVIDQMTDFIEKHIAMKGESIFGGQRRQSLDSRRDVAMEILPFLRGRVSQQKRLIGSYSDLPEVLEFVNSADAAKLAYLGTSCPDHFIRTKIRPLFVDWDAATGIDSLKQQIESGLTQYRADYAAYYNAHRDAESPAMRDPNPTMVLISGAGMFSFGKNKAESRITGEFYVNAIHVMKGAAALEEGKIAGPVPQSKPSGSANDFKVEDNYVALPASEAFRIEYWKLEEAKIRRQPPEKELSRQVVLVVGGGSGIGREVALLAAERGAHVVVADRDQAAAQKVAEETNAISGKETAVAAAVDIRSRDSIRAAMRETVASFGGIDILVNTAALFPTSPDGVISEAQWALTLEVNVTANYLLVEEIGKLLRDQNLASCVVLTSSANAVVPKKGSEAYDVSKAALSHLVRELAVSQAPLVRVNGISPATVVKGSTMFPRDRVIASLKKYEIPFDANLSDEELRMILAKFYAKRTLTHQPIDPRICAESILFLAGPKAPCTTGHMIPVDGGLTDAFLR
ncbi:bifunctional rhamnulose-1-phosphate aldolase/short-chain dehydrogenase [Alloacidobacterium dinghuense]|uniref:Bifunctional rhamnulose-1-phosphate aldolase/short-chain dehydrogenase n=1 Tax=Alloacidobacterium dinghuense TaxID=2763107 RepID=A0A7G8BK58_9BACT|nr:bifunctional rhamnulose-1-phosphate aldolase/short-chain dehydrogenase [Alloacidobacterium dinghuense]QNI32928.1 bifunctional rhamnulose-1-phosphate aldolase/short-chain dehydrogenase [Alloacidobacterium dinghuense]